MRKKLKLTKIILLVLCILMMIPTGTLKVYAVEEADFSVTNPSIDCQSTACTFENLSSLWEQAKSSGSLEITLSKDITGKRIVIPTESTIVMNLAGHTVNRNLKAAQEDGEVINVGIGASLTLKNGTVTGGFSNNSAGGIHAYKNSKIVLDNIVLTGNQATTTAGYYGYGGGVMLDGNGISLTLQNNTFVSANRAVYGGGIYANGSKCTVSLDQSSVQNNTAEKDGGGIYVGGASSNIEGIKENSAYTASVSSNSAQNGAGIYVYTANDTVSSLVIQNNTASQNGGGIALGSGASKFSLANCEVKENTAINGGGMDAGPSTIYASKAVTITSSKITGNTVTGIGGGIYEPETNAIKMSLSGKVEVNGNNANGSVSNYYVNGNSIQSAPGSDSSIGITLYKSNPINTSFSIAGTFYSSAFFADKDGYTIEYKNRKLTYVTGSQKTNTTIDPVTTRPEKQSFTYNDQEVIRGYYSYSESFMEPNDAESVYYYSDGYFVNDASTYDEHLASMSYALVMSAFESSYGGDGLEDSLYYNKFAHVKQLLSDIGCADADIYISDSYTKKPTTSSIAYAIASKAMTINDSTYYLIPVVVRSAGYESEWASNVTIGTEGEATGFSNAATQVYNAIQSYLTYEGEKSGDFATALSEGRIKFWVTGFSRGGATANLTSKRLIDAYPDISVYAYTFEAPQGGEPLNNGENETKYACIHNIINQNDIVPYVAPSEMSIYRYGVDHYVPGDNASVATYKTDTGGIARLSDNNVYSVGSSAYASQLTKMLTQLKMVNVRADYDDYFNLASMYYLQYAVGIGDLMQEVKSGHNANYWLPLFIKNLQEGMLKERSEGTTLRNAYSGSGMYFGSVEESARTIFGLYFGLSAENKTALTSYFMTAANHLSLVDIYFNVLGNWVKKDKNTRQSYLDSWWSTFTAEYNGVKLSDIVGEEKLESVHSAFNVLFDELLCLVDVDYNTEKYDTGTTQVDLGTLGYNVSRLLENHYGEVIMAWLRSYDSFYENETGAYEYALSADYKPATPTSIQSGKKLTLQGDAGSAIYYKVGEGEWQLYFEPITLSDTTTITYYSVAYDTCSDQETYTPVQYSVTIDGGTPTYYFAGEIVKINAATVTGQQFTGWYVTEGAVALSSASSASTWFTMPASDVILAASYVLKAPEITVTSDETGNSNATITAAEGASIYYTINGSEPTTESYQYTGPFTLSAGTTLKAIAVKDDQYSAVTTYPDATVSKPVVTRMDVTTDATGTTVTGATLTLADGSSQAWTPANNPTLMLAMPGLMQLNLGNLEGTYEISESTMVYMNGNVLDGFFESVSSESGNALNFYYDVPEEVYLLEVESLDDIDIPYGSSVETYLPYEIQLEVTGGKATGTIDWDSGDVANASASQSGSYVIHGTITLPQGVQCTNPDALNISVTVNYLGLKSAGSVSADVSAGTYLDAVHVSLQATDSEAAVYYTLDGSDPASSDTRKQYTGESLCIEETTTLKAVAVKVDCANSAVASYTYTIQSSVGNKDAIKDSAGVKAVLKENGISNPVSYTFYLQVDQGYQPTAAVSEAMESFISQKLNNANAPLYYNIELWMEVTNQNGKTYNLEIPSTLDVPVECTISIPGAFADEGAGDATTYAVIGYYGDQCTLYNGTVNTEYRLLSFSCTNFSTKVSGNILTSPFALTWYTGTKTESSNSGTKKSESTWKPTYHVIFRDFNGNVISEQWVTEGESAVVPEGYFYNESSVYWVYKDLDLWPVNLSSGTFIIPDTGTR